MTVKYCDEKEREYFELYIKNGYFYYKINNNLVNTPDEE